MLRSTSARQKPIERDVKQIDTSYYDKRIAKLRGEAAGLRDSMSEIEAETMPTTTASDTPSSSSSETPSTKSTSLEGDEGGALNTIFKYESQGSGGYDAYNLGGADGGHTAIGSGDSKDGKFGKALSTMTLGEIDKLGQSGKIHATGRYQFTHNTGSFREAMQFAGLSPTDPFSPANQDKRALAFGKKYGSSRWVGLKNATGAEMEQIRRVFGR